MPEVIPGDNATLSSIALAFEDNWLSRYPVPVRCLYDNCDEFLGPAFPSVLIKNKIKYVLVTVNNPKSNAIVERIHQSISTTIAISLRENPPAKYEDISNLFFTKCMAVQHTISRSIVNMTLKHKPGELAFGRDMILPISSDINWKYLFQCKQINISQTNEKEDQSRKDHDYRI